MSSSISTATASASASASAGGRSPSVGAQSPLSPLSQSQSPQSQSSAAHHRNINQRQSRSRPRPPPSSLGIKEFISAANYEMKSLMDYLEIAGEQMKKGAELDEINDLKKYIALTLSHWKRNSSVATESYVELSGLLNLEKSIIQNQQSIISEQDNLLSLLNQEKDTVNSKVKEAEGLLRSNGIISDDIDVNNTDSL